MLNDGNPVFYAQRAIDLLRKHDYQKELGYAYLVMGASQSWYAHDVKRAVSFYDSAIASAKFSGDFTVQGRALYGLSVLYQQVVGREGAKRKMYEACKTLELGDAECKLLPQEFLVDLNYEYGREGKIKRGH